MAYINFALVLERIREVATEGVVLGYRSIVTGAYESGLFDGLDDSDKSMRAMDVPIIEPRVVSMRRHEASPPFLHALWLYDVEIEVAVVRHLNTKHMLTSETRDSVLALAMRDADVLGQAFSVAGGLSTTVEAGATNIVSGVMWHLGSSAGRLELATERPGLVETVHRFGCVIQVTAQVP